jgi:meiotically up-regulated gene 157 (Mug157) protein
MIRTSFLPSDDSPRLPYFIPANAFAVTELNATASMLRALPSSAAAAASGGVLAREAQELAEEVRAGIERWGVVTHSSGARIFAMEVDGFVSSRWCWLTD